MKDTEKKVNIQPEMVRTKRVPLKDFFKGVWIELVKRIKWPNRKEMINYSIIVISFIIFWSIYIGVWDFVFAKLVELIVQ